MADKNYGKIGSGYSREIDMCVEFKDKLMDALDDYNFDFPQSLETEITYSDRRG